MDNSIVTLLVALAAVVMFLLTLALFAICASRTIGPDSRFASLVCKVSYLLHLPVPRVERARFLFYPRSEPSGPPLDTATTSECPESAGNDVYGDAPLLLPAILDHVPTSEGLVIALAGGSVRGIGALRTTFRRTLQSPDSSTSMCDHLFVLDPSGMSFYSQGFRQVASLVRAVSAKYKRVLIVGNCMGGTGCLLLARCVSPLAGCVVNVFNPEINPKLDARLAFRVGHCLQRKRVSGLQSAILASLGNAPRNCCVVVHSSTWPCEAKQADLLQYDDTVSVPTVARPDNQLLHAALHERGGGASAEEEGGGRLMHVVHQGVAEHGLVRRLRSSRVLSAWLDAALALAAALEPNEGPTATEHAAEEVGHSIEDGPVEVGAVRLHTGTEAVADISTDIV